MTVTVAPRRISGTLDLPPSDREVCRMLAASAFSSQSVILRCPGTGADSHRMIELLTNLGAKITRDCGEIHITPIPRPAPSVESLDFGSSEACLKILLPSVCLLHTGVRFLGQGVLAGENPAFFLTSLLAEHGCAFDSPTLPFYADGTPDRGIYGLSQLPDEDSLFGLALMLSLSVGGGQMETSVRLPDSLTEVFHILSFFGVGPEETLHGWYFPAGEWIPEAEVLSPRGDSVLACLWLAAGACCGPVTVRGADPSSAAISALLPLLEVAGATVVVNGSSISAFSEKRLCPTEFFEVPSVLLPALTVLCSETEQDVRIYAPTSKDSGFAASVVALNQSFSPLGKTFSYCEGICSISGTLGSSRCATSPFPEVLAALLLSSSVCRIPLQIEGCEELLSYWRSFLNDFRLLNGEYTVNVSVSSKETFLGQ